MWPSAASDRHATHHDRTGIGGTVPAMTDTHRAHPEPDLRPDEAAQLLRVGRRKVLDLIASGELQAYRLGHRTIRIRRADVDRLRSGVAAAPP